MWQSYYQAVNIHDALKVMDQFGPKGRIIAGGTDLIIEMERGIRKGIDVLIDVTRIPGLDGITLDGMGNIHIGPSVTHNQCASSGLIHAYGLPLAQAAWEVGSPQIRNRGTIAGNLITASPANDTITPLLALDGSLELSSISGKRIIRLSEFYTGVRKTVLGAGEMVTDIYFPAMKPNQFGIFTKYALRKAQAISVVNSAIVLQIDDGIVTSASITFGAVAPTIIHAKEAEAFLLGKSLNEQNITMAAELIQLAIHPINDIRGSANFRRKIAQVITQRGLDKIANGNVKSSLPEQIIQLKHPSRTHGYTLSNNITHNASIPIVATINGKVKSFPKGQDKTLLRLLREDGHLTGTKEGCAEGECGACTVFLDGMAVMSCLVPAPRAHGSDVTTIEGISTEEILHPVQEAFIKEDAVQCGYCTPGFIMSGVMLLEENNHPSKDQIKQALTGNLCRCTGYYKIIKAIERAVEGVKV
jgi:xanthine dehydrogenase iron-sulfur cluster and FAD-binding subunit A